MTTASPTLVSTNRRHAVLTALLCLLLAVQTGRGSNNSSTSATGIGTTNTSLVAAVNVTRIAAAAPKLEEESVKYENIQPCSPYDSCKGRCVDDNFDRELPGNVTIGYLNCFCDPDCMSFG